MSHMPFKKPVELWRFRGQDELVIAGNSLRRSGVSKGWICTAHGEVSPSKMWRHQREYMVCWLCCDQSLEIAKPILNPNANPNEPRTSLADELERELLARKA